MNNKIPPSKANHDRWLVSYADFITLLFAFFVVLYAFAKADQKRQLQISSAIDSGFQSLSIAPGKSGSGWSASTEPPSLPTARQDLPEMLFSSAKVQADLELIRRDLQQRLSKQIMQGKVSISLGRDGLVISLREAGFFDSGSAIPHAETDLTLRQIADTLADSPYDVRVEGHTDTNPIHNAEFDSNWELSSARAMQIARRLLAMRAIPPDQLSVAGYAEYHPAAGNDTPQGRAQNRRVDLVVLPRIALDLSDPARGESKSAWRKIVDEQEP